MESKASEAKLAKPRERERERAREGERWREACREKWGRGREGEREI